MEGASVRRTVLQAPEGWVRGWLDIILPPEMGEDGLKNLSGRERTVTTGWIDTGFGPGHHLVAVNLEASLNRYTVQGDFSLAKEMMPTLPQQEVKSTVVLDTESGCFQVLIRFKKSFRSPSLRLCYAAVRESIRQETKEPKFYIANPPKQIHVGWQYTFRVAGLSQEEAQQRVTWKVSGPQGTANAGSIDCYGCYTAPMEPGIYEITASYTADGEKDSMTAASGKAPEPMTHTASTYVVVRD